MSSKTAGKQNPAPAAMQPMLLDTTQAGVFGGTEVPATLDKRISGHLWGSFFGYNLKFPVLFV